jgi:hypothetical protein
MQRNVKDKQLQRQKQILRLRRRMTTKKQSKCNGNEKNKASAMAT